MHVSSPAQRKGWADAYMTDVDAGGEFFKLGDTYGDGRGYRPAVTAMWASGEAVLLRQSLPAHVVADYGGARELWQRYDFAQPGGKARGAAVRVNVATPSLPLPSRFRAPGTVLGVHEIFTTANPYGKYFLGPDNILGVKIAHAGHGDGLRQNRDAHNRELVAALPSQGERRAQVRTTPCRPRYWADFSLS